MLSSIRPGLVVVNTGKIVVHQEEQRIFSLCRQIQQQATFFLQPLIVCVSRPLPDTIQIA